jgi:hypothetical protein
VLKSLGDEPDPFTGPRIRDLGLLKKIMDENTALAEKLSTVGVEDKSESPTATAHTTARKVPDWEKPSDETTALMKGIAPHTVVQAFDLLKCESTVVFETAPKTEELRDNCC